MSGSPSSATTPAVACAAASIESQVPEFAATSPRPLDALTHSATMVATSVAGPSGLSSSPSQRFTARNANANERETLDQVEPMDIDDDALSSISTDDDTDDSDLQEASCLKTPLRSEQHATTYSLAAHRPRTTVNFFCSDEDDPDMDVIAIEAADNYGDTSRARLMTRQTHSTTMDDLDGFGLPQEQYSITSNGSKRSLRSERLANQLRAEVSSSRQGTTTSTTCKSGTATRLHVTSPHTITCRPISESSSVAQLSIASSCASDPSLPMCKICHLNAKDVSAAFGLTDAR